MKKSNLILVIFIIFIMVSSVIGFIYAPNDNGDLNQNLITYNGLDFQLTTDNRYVVDLNGNQILFDNDPNSLEEIILPNFQITQDKVYLIFNPEERDNNLDYSMAKLYSTLQVKGVRPVLACSKEENCSSDLPVKGCDSESFYFKKSNITNIYKDNKCIVLQGADLIINKYVDKIDMSLIGA